MNTLGDRLLEVMQELDLKNPRALADFCGVSEGLVSQWFSGQTKLGPKPLKAFSRTNFSLDWLTTGELPKKRQGTSNIEPGPKIRGDVPVISWVTAGTWALVSDPYEPGVASNWLPCPKSHSKRTFALRVRGVSMENLGGKYSYSDGDVIFVDPERHPDNGSRIIVRLDESKEATFKQLVIEGDKKYLKALNPAWPEKIIEINGNATICGVVIGKWTDE